MQDIDSEAVCALQPSQQCRRPADDEDVKFITDEARWATCINQTYSGTAQVEELWGFGADVYSTCKNYLRMQGEIPETLWCPRQGCSFAALVLNPA